MKLNLGSKRRLEALRTSTTTRQPGKMASPSKSKLTSPRQSGSRPQSRHQGRRPSSVQSSSVTRQPSTAPVRLRSWRAKLQPMFLPSDVPIWLQSLVKIQQGVWFSAAVLSAFALGTYGWSVYSQQQWGRAYSQLQKLQRDERQLISGNELVKNEIVQKVDPKRLGLAPRKSDNVIFIQPDQAQTSPPAAASPLPNQSEQSVKQPLGY